jgi:hypothetical protein
MQLMGSDEFFLATGRLTRLQRSTAAALPFGRRHRHLAERRATGPDFRNRHDEFRYSAVLGSANSPGTFL